MGVGIQVDNVIKRYGDHTVINGLSLEINPGEFFTLLGPSGCGKTTLLRMIIGFNSIEGGEIRVDGQVVNNIPTNRRNMGMVFQNYAVFPHMNVRDNVAYGLKTRKIARGERRKKADELLKLVKIDQYADRMPAQLSGGQQQRVALARAIVIEPDVLLMDEPLSNLDAKLRVEMRNVIKRIQRQIGITTVYVTHDQEEALASSLLVFMRVFSDFGTPMLIGEGYRTFPVVLYNQFMGEVTNDSYFAAALCMIIMAITLVFFFLQRWVARKHTYSMSALKPMQPRTPKRLPHILCHVFVYLVVLLALLPQITVIATSFMKESTPGIFTGEFSLINYQTIFSKNPLVLSNTYLYGLAAIALVVVFGIMISYLAVRRMPYTIRSSTAIIGQISPSIEEASISLGASELRSFGEITVPMMLPGVLSGAIMSWVTVISELSSSIMLYRASTQTLTVSIYTEVIRDCFGNAAAYSTVLTVTSVLSLLLFFKLTGRKDISI